MIGEMKRELILIGYPMQSGKLVYIISFISKPVKVIILSYSIFDISTLINLGRAKPIEVVRRCMFQIQDGVSFFPYFLVGHPLNFEKLSDLYYLNLLITHHSLNSLSTFQYITSQITILKQFSNESDVLYFRANNPWIGRVQCVTSSGMFFSRDLGQERLLQNVRKGSMETEHD